MFVEVSTGGGVVGRSRLTGLASCNAEEGAVADARSGVVCRASLGKGGRNSGMCSGGCQLADRGRFLGGVDGLDIGESGRVGVAGRGLVAPRSGSQVGATSMDSDPMYSSMAESRYLAAGFRSISSSSLSSSSSSEVSGLCNSLYTRENASSRSSRKPIDKFATEGYNQNEGYGQHD